MVCKTQEIGQMGHRNFETAIIWPTITLTSIYLQLAFILIGRAAEPLHEGSREIYMDGQKENLPENLLNVWRIEEISSVSLVSVGRDEKFTNCFSLQE